MFGNTRCCRSMSCRLLTGVWLRFWNDQENRPPKQKYSEIWSFYNKDRTFTSVFCDGFDEDDNYIKRMEEFHFILPCKDYPMGKMRGPGEWFGNHFQTYEEIDSSNMDYNHSIWDALDGEPEAAGNIDYEW